MPPSTVRETISVSPGFWAAWSISCWLRSGRSCIRPSIGRFSNSEISLEPSRKRETGEGRHSGLRFQPMMRKRMALLAFPAVALSGADAWAQAGPQSAPPISNALTGAGALGAFLTMLSDRLDHTVEHIPKIGRYLLALPGQFDLR